jgi:hypothetical protein
MLIENKYEDAHLVTKACYQRGSGVLVMYRSFI